MLQKVYYTVGEQKIRKSLIFNIQFLKARPAFIFWTTKS